MLQEPSIHARKPPIPPISQATDTTCDFHTLTDTSSCGQSRSLQLIGARAHRTRIKTHAWLTHRR